MKKLISMLLAVIMIGSVMTVPTFAYGEEFIYGSTSAYGMEYDPYDPAVIRETDEYGKMIYVHGSPLNNKVFPLEDAPAMEHTRTIGSVTFSNYIKHNEKILNGRDNDGNRAKLNVTQVYVGIGASMRAEVDSVEFMVDSVGIFNAIPGPLLGEGYGGTSDLRSVKTNTPQYTLAIPLATGGGTTPSYTFLDYLSIRPYTNLGRSRDGTWQKGLTWVFEEHTKATEGGSGWGYLDDPNRYMKIYAVRVESPNGTEYYQVIVTNDTNFAGEQQEIPAEENKPAAVPALKSFSDVGFSRWSHDAIMNMVELGIFSGTTTPDVNGVGTFDPTGTMTQAQFITVVTRYLFNDELSGMGQGAYWYSNNYDIALKYDLIEPGEFSLSALNGPITRQEMAMIAVRVAKAQGEADADLVSIDQIADYSAIDSYYQGSVREAFSMGLIAGTDSLGTFAPRNTLTREQGAMVAYRLVNPGTRSIPVAE